MSDKEISPAMRNFRFQRIIAFVGAILMLTKFFAYFLTNSVSILTDALESIVNVIAGIVGLYALYLSMQPADSSHPYGHGKVELISSSIEGSMIMIAGAMILFESAERMLSGDYSLRSLDFGLAIVAFAAAVNFAMGFTAIKMGRESKSVALEASGKHLCSDTYSSVGIFVGLILVYIGSYFGLDINWLDPVMAMCFGIFILYTGIRVFYNSMNGIMDRADIEILRQVTRCINHVRTDDVLDVHHLRVNRYGAAVHVDAHMTVPGWVSVNETEKIVEDFRSETENLLGDNVDITFMAEACGEKFCRHCPHECEHRHADFVQMKVLSTEYVTRGDFRNRKNE